MIGGGRGGPMLIEHYLKVTSTGEVKGGGQGWVVEGSNTNTDLLRGCEVGAHRGHTQITEHNSW